MFIADTNISLGMTFGSGMVLNGRCLKKGKILAEEYWGLKNLAYEIKKNKKAHYTMLIIETLPDKIEEYERKLRLHEDIIRFMTI